MALLDLDARLEVLNSVLRADPLFKLLNPDGLTRLATGVYDGTFNLGTHLKNLRYQTGRPLWKIEDYPVSKLFQGLSREERREVCDRRNDFGVADSLDQILEYFKPEVEDHDSLFVIGATLVKRDLSNKGKGGGWRWHKWGPYIGTRERTTEYLDDEPEIDSVLVFHIYGVTELPP